MNIAHHHSDSCVCMFFCFGYSFIRFFLDIITCYYCCCCWCFLFISGSSIIFFLNLSLSLSLVHTLDTLHHHHHHHFFYFPYPFIWWMCILILIINIPMVQGLPLSLLFSHSRIDSLPESFSLFFSPNACYFFSLVVIIVIIITMMRWDKIEGYVSVCVCVWKKKKPDSRFSMGYFMAISSSSIFFSLNNIVGQKKTTSQLLPPPTTTTTTTTVIGLLDRIDSPPSHQQKKNFISNHN